MADITRKPFGVLPDGTAVEQYTLRAGDLSCDLLTYGGILRALRVPDRTGQPVDVVLGFDTLEDYCRQDKYLGALVGRYANRIAGGRFSLEDQEYVLACNDGPNHLHGGLQGFSGRVWTAENAGERFLALSLQSPDGDQGYPGALSVRVVYQLSETGLTIEYLAQSDRTTICNLTNHSYFNLAGQDAGSVLNQTIQIFADYYTPTDSVSIPQREIAPVEGTPMDLRTPVAIGAGIARDFSQLQMAGGYDHNWVIRGETGVLRPAAAASCAETGITLSVQTTLPGVQFYTGNFLEGCPSGKGGAVYKNRDGFCLETQFFPDTPNHPSFPSCTLRPDQVWRHTTVFQFGLL